MTAEATSLSHLLSALQGAAGQRGVVVIGDLMLDRYVSGSVERISPEAPVPVMRVEREVERAGGAGNVAANLAGLGLRVTVCGLVGTDPEGERLVRLLEEREVDAAGVVRREDPGTVCKTRFLGGHQQMLRVDAEKPIAATTEQGRTLAAAVVGALEDSARLVIVSDYAKGTLTRNVCRMVIEAAGKRNLPVLVDPKGRDYARYRGALGITPNRRELLEVTGGGGDWTGPPRVSTPPDGEAAAWDRGDGLAERAARLREDLDLAFVLVTLSEAGMLLVRRERKGGGVVWIPSSPVEVFDVTGAGDTVVAVLGAGVLCGLPLEEAARAANAAAGIVVGRLGTAPIDRAMLARAAS